MMNAKRISRHALFVVGALAASTAFAGEATLFANRDFQGPSMTVRGPSPSLGRFGVNDKASSLVVRAGVWEVCSMTYFDGYGAQLLPYVYTSLVTHFNTPAA